MASLITKSAVKKLALEVAKTRWPDGRMNRVSKEFLDDVEAKVRNVVVQKVHQHPTLGKTLK